MHFSYRTVTAAMLALASTVSALEDERTTQIKQDLIDFCGSLNGKQGSQGANCFDISGAFHSAILAAKATAAPCERTELAQKLVDNFGDANGVIEMAQKMAHAPINVIPPKELPGVDAPCPTPLNIDGKPVGGNEDNQETKQETTAAATATATATTEATATAAPNNEAEKEKERCSVILGLTKTETATVTVNQAEATSTASEASETGTTTLAATGTTTVTFGATATATATASPDGELPVFSGAVAQKELFSVGLMGGVLAALIVV